MFGLICSWECGQLWIFYFGRRYLATLAKFTNDVSPTFGRAEVKMGAKTKVWREGENELEKASFIRAKRMTKY